MPTYVMLGRLTALAKGNMTEARKRRDKLWDDFRKLGLKISSYMTMGQYDVVTIIDAPTEQLAMRFLIAAGATGNIDSTTLRAFTDQEVEKLSGG
ncbi:MAG: GYD domain-containing protein [Thermoplasmata archaeon]|nr:GYD domain-containing protein [Thermoplasmata archaeon]